MSNLEALFESEIPSGRQALQDSYTNLQDVAAYCEDNYLKCDNKRGALEETKNYTTQALASVAYQINTLATGMLQMLDLQATQLAQMESSINHITQNVNVHKEKVARREIGVLTTSKNCPRTHKIVAPANPEKPMKYKSTPIDYSQLDNVGHGMVLSSTTTRTTRTPDPRRSRRSPSIGSTASTGTSESGGGGGGMFAIPQPGVDTRDNRFNSLGRGGRARPPIQPPAAPTPPVTYASATLPRQMPSDMKPVNIPGRTPSFSHQQSQPQPYMIGMHQQNPMGGMPLPVAPPPPEMMGHISSRSASGPMHPQGMPPPPPMQPQYPQPGEQRMSIGDQRVSMGEQRMSIGDQRMSVGDQRMSVGDQRMSVGDQRMAMGDQRMVISDQRMAMGDQRVSFGEQRMSVDHRMSSSSGFGSGIPAPPPPPMMMIGGDMPPPPGPEIMSPPPPPPPPADMGYMATGNQDMPPPPEFLQEDEPDWLPPNYIEKVVAIYDYAKEREDELSFEEGATVYVLKKNPDGWYEGIMDGITGLFPGNYVEACP